MEKQIYLTDIEILFLEELERRGLKRGIDFATQYPIRLSFILDFAFPEQKIVIETDGEAYHPTKRDVVKDKILEKNGWKIFRFWGSEIKEDCSKCVDKVLKEIG